jgi:ribonuclease HI
MVHLYFLAFNNVAEYEALINGLCVAIEMGIQWLDIWGDLQHIIDQGMKELSCHKPKMVAYCQEELKLEEKFDGLELNYIPWRLNEATDELVKMASNRESVLAGIFGSDQTLGPL